MNKNQPMRPSMDENRNAQGEMREGAIVPALGAVIELPSDYQTVLSALKKRIQTERIQVALSANATMVLLYWDIGYGILSQQAKQGWGAKIIDRLSHDLKTAFPDMSGLSPRNLKYMRKFAESWPDRLIVQRTIAQIPWRSNLALLDKLNESEDRLWYARKTIENGWSRDVLVMQMESQLHLRQGKAQNNFDRALPPTESDMTAQIFKDPYLFDFIGTADPRNEWEIEQGLIDHIQQFLLELGAGFSFVGRQMLLEVGNKDFYIDLLFYHLKLRRFVVIDLKNTSFDPEFTGKMNFYLSAVDDLLTHETDQPAIGLLLCKSKNKLVVEYALRGVKSPIGVAEWQTSLVEQLPDNLQGSLPSVEEIEAVLGKELGI